MTTIVRSVPVKSVELDFEPECLTELTLVVRSVELYGLKIPFPVIRKDSGYLVKGREIFFLAAKQLGLATIPVVEIPNEREHDRGAIASLAGPSDNPIDLARRIRHYQARYDINQTKLGCEFGISQSLISRYLRLLDGLYPQTIKRYQHDLRVADTSRNHRGNPANRMGSIDIGFRHLYELTHLHQSRSGHTEKRSRELQLRLMAQMTSKCPSVRGLHYRVKAIAKRPTTVRVSHVESVPRIRTYLTDGRFLLNVVPPQSVHLVLTSPPYNFDKPYEASLPMGEHLENIVPPLQAAALALCPGGWYFLNVLDYKLSCGDYLPVRDILIYALRACGMKFVSPSVWAKRMIKDQNGSNELRQHPNYRIMQNLEYMLVFRKLGDRQVDPELAELSKAQIRDDANGNEWRSFAAVMHFNSELRGDDTGAVGNAVMSDCLADFIVRGFSLIGDHVLDPFAGTGTTPLAAQKNNREGIGIEISPKVFRQHLALYKQPGAVPKIEPLLPSGWRGILQAVLESLSEPSSEANKRRLLAE